jgi:hypothetical protein
MRIRIKNLLLTGMVAVLVASLAGCFYYRRVDDDHHHHYSDSRDHRW